MNEILFKIYEVVSDYLCGEDGSQLETISKVVDLYMQICNEAMPAEIDGLLQSAVNHINHDVDAKTLEEHIGDGYNLIEELSGYLAEYFE